MLIKIISDILHLRLILQGSTVLSDFTCLRWDLPEASGVRALAPTKALCDALKKLLETRAAATAFLKGQKGDSLKGVEENNLTERGKHDK